VEDYLRHREVIEEAVKAQNIAQVVAVFKSLDYKSALNSGLKSYEETASTASLDISIDRFFYEQLTESYENLPKKEQKHAYYYVSLESDSFTLLTLLRGKALDYDPNWLRLTVPKKNFDLHTGTVESLVSAVDFESALKVVFTTHYAKYFVRAQTPEDTIGNAEKAFRKALFQYAQASVVIDSFNIGAPLSYMYQQEVEVHNLSVLSLGIEAQMKPEDIRNQLLL
jgi:vacuolar-type H+-ATPase subunit C/Vma6